MFLMLLELLVVPDQSCQVQDISMLTPVWNFRHLVQLVMERLLEAFETLNSPCSGEPPVHGPCSGMSLDMMNSRQS